MLKPWIQIKTKFGTDLWQPNIIISINNNNLVIPILENYINYNILEHDFIKISFDVDKFKVFYLCIVEELLFEENLKMSLKILKEELWENIRNAERTEINSLCQMILDKNVFNAYIADISTTGCRIISSEQLDKNVVYTIHIYKEYRINSNFIRLYGVIKRWCTCGTKLEYGIQFVNSTDEELKTISVLAGNAKRHKENFINKLLIKYNPDYKQTSSQNSKI